MACYSGRLTIIERFGAPDLLADLFAELASREERGK